ncbi:MAG: M28 family peptidase [Bdellovibrionales bacterium]|nr:M28 family peptidase [Oligoflexia bacterium]
MQLKTLSPLFTLYLCLSLSACELPWAKNEKDSVPIFDENQAYSQILAYEKFGPKVPGTSAHVQGGDWIVSELKKTTALIHEQKTEAKTFDGKTIPVRNIIAQLNPEAKERYLLSAHWDNRPFSDEDKDKKYKNIPTPGVNDGGSGVVVLLGIAKALSGKSMAIGVDLAFFDAEDWGSPSNEETYCLGTQYWAKNPVPAHYQAKFGINYDMVGRIGSVFPVESYSAQKAPEAIAKLQAAARKIGYQDLFPNTRTGYVIDDHIYIMHGLGFPVMDLIYMSNGRFPPEWHTHLDTSEFISRDILKAVGQTTLQMLWDQSP